MRYFTLALLLQTVLLSKSALLPKGKPDMKNRVLSTYEEKAGYIIDNNEQQKIYNFGWSPTYGEITPEGASQLIKEYKLNSTDVFYDLGSGVGKLVFQVFLESNVKKSAGVELSPTRLSYAKRILDQFKNSLPANTSKRIIEFHEQNMLDADLSDATAIYIASTCFSDDVMAKLAKKLSHLKPGLRFVTLTKLPEPHHFRLDKELTIPMSWSSKSTAYFYILEPKKAKN